MTDPAHLTLLTELAAALTKEARAPWGVTVDRPVMALHGPDAAELVIYQHNGRLEISGHCGEARGYLPPGVGPFVITVADSRPVPAIAREIATRLLPKYLPAFAEARERLHDRQARTQAAEGVLQELIAAAGGGHRAVNERQVVGYTKLPAVSEIHVLPAGGADAAPTVSLRLCDLDVDTARNVVRLLRGAAKRTETRP